MLWRNVDFRPGLVGIKGFNLSRELVGLWAEILLEHGAIVTDHKSHDARIAVLRGIGDKREAANHLAFGQIVVGSARRIRALAGKDAIVISVIRDRRLTGFIALG